MHIMANRWYAILSPRELAAGRPVAAKRFGRDFVFWRGVDGKPRAAVDACPHRGAKLSPGRLVDGCLECPFHGFRFDDEGACREIPAHPDRRIPKKMALDTWTVREEHELLWMWTGPDAAPDTPIPFFDVLQGLRYDGSERTLTVRTHYTRAIENQLDFAHLAFVHKKTIGRFLPSPVMNVGCEVEGDLIRAWDERTPQSSVRFLGPNIWTLNTGNARQFLAFVPVDDHNMRYYTRAYQPFVKSAPLAWLLGRFTQLTNGFVFNEDTAVVESQPAEETRVKMNEVLVPSDLAIVAYRRWREKNRYLPTTGRRLPQVVDAAA